MSKKNEPSKLLTLRAAVILVVAVLVAGGAAALAYAKYQDFPAAAIAGVTAFAATVTFLDKLVE